MAGHVVTAPAVQVVAGARAHFLERGAVLPEGVAADVLERLVDEGLIEKVANAEVTPAGSEGVEVPEGNPAASWKVEQIDAWAARQDPPVLFAEGAKKDEKLAAIAELNKS